ncbi:MAG: 30S ribosomal protein S6 [Desulfobacca sp.]|uniref:30S ribosomal protein S6 n=1 Tax=Desulfobacca sp. TaxID=2067990 RepID=UPI00404B3997
MHRYETIFVVNPDLSDDETQNVINKFTGIISAAGGVPLKLDDWGRRRLAYKIDKFSQGYYVLVDFAAAPAGLMELERNLKIDDRIIRFLSVKTGINVNVEALQQELAAKAKPVEEVAAAPEGEGSEVEAAPLAAAAPTAEQEPGQTPEE